MRLLFIEGLDGVGKESISKKIVELLNEKYNKKAKYISFPDYSSSFGISIKRILNGECGDPTTIDPYLMGPVYSFDRIAYFMHNLESLSKEYDYLIMDRSYYSNFIYQCSKLMPDYSYNSIKRNIDTFIPFNNIVKWCLKNYLYEFIYTRLICYEDDITSTIYITLPESLRVKQISNREDLDDNESNLPYLEKCKKFVELMVLNDPSIHEYKTQLYNNIYNVMSDFVYRERYFDSDIRYNDSILLFNNVFDRYFRKVYIFDSLYATNKEDIDSCNTKTADAIIQKFIIDVEERATNVNRDRL